MPGGHGGLTTPASPSFPTPVAASPQLPPAGAELPGPCRFLKTSPSSGAMECEGLQLPPAATSCTSTARGLCPMRGDPTASSASGCSSRISPPQAAGGCGGRESLLLIPESRQSLSHCTARSPGCDTAGARGTGGSDSPSVTPPSSNAPEKERGAVVTHPMSLSDTSGCHWAS